MYLFKGFKSILNHQLAESGQEMMQQVKRSSIFAKLDKKHNWYPQFYMCCDVLFQLSLVSVLSLTKVMQKDLSNDEILSTRQTAVLLVI
jgi:hypothetical protein